MKIIVALLTSTFLISGAYAQSPDQSPGISPSAKAPSAAMVKADAKRDAKVEMHIKDLHAKLNINAAEESQWADVAKTMRENVNDLDQAIDKREALLHHATAIDDLNAYGDVAQAHADAVKKLSAVFTPLYAAMSDGQKKAADEVFGQHRRGGKNEPVAMK